jgi:HPt (histidine-containing phosphotransfer) domain-containing protein
MPEGQGSAGEAASNGTRLSSCRSDPALDLVHLSRQCQGDPDLEAELLGLFRLQLRGLSLQLCDLATSTPELKARIAHRLRGSALAVGAGRVARAAKAIEDKALALQDPARADARHLEAVSQAVAALEAAVAEVVAEIALIRS